MLQVLMAVQYQAIQDRMEQLIEAAGKAGVNVLCLQEAWSTSTELRLLTLSLKLCLLPSAPERSILGWNLLWTLRPDQQPNSVSG